MTKWQKLTARFNPNYMHIFKPWKNDVQSGQDMELDCISSWSLLIFLFCIKIGMKLYTKLLLQGTHCLYPFIESEVRKWQSSQSGKKWQILIQGLYPNPMRISKPWRKHMQSFKKIGIKLFERLRSQGTHSLYTFINSEIRNRQSSRSRIKTKINSRIISKPHAHHQTMTKTRAKLKIYRHNNVWKVALTRYQPVYTFS